jgi:two-component system chemotaxis sensor kinase CheA
VDLPAVEALAHRLEALLLRLREGAAGPPDPGALALCRRVLDAVEDQAGASRGGRPADAGPLLAEIDALSRPGEPARARPAARAPATAPPPAAPPAAAPGPSAFDARGPDAAEGVPPAQTEPAGAGRVEAVRIDAARLDRVLRTAGELAAEQHRVDAAGREMQEFERQVEELERGWTALRRSLGAVLPAFGAAAGEHAPARMLDEFEGRLRRLGRAGRQAARRHAAAARAARQTGDALHAQLREASMVPAASAFEGARKMVRDLAADLGRSVAVEVRGLEVEADRLVLQELKDPVMHLLRNAVGHGIEPPGEREARGKPAEGRVSLGFRVAGGRLVVTVRDDGRGFDRAAVAEAARRRGLLAPGAPAPEGGALLDLLFAPGLSTREVADSVAGRGMGLSVVRDRVARLDGTATAWEPPGGGARFRISVPVSTSARSLLLVRAGARVFGLPGDGVDRLLRVDAASVGSVGGRPAVAVEGRMVPLAALSALLGAAGEAGGEAAGAAVEATRSRVPVVVLGEDEPALAVAVDELLGFRNALVKDLGLPAPPGALAAGGTLLEDGGVAVVLNPQALAAAARRRGAAALELRERGPARRAPVVLVVDDSLTTRTLERGILEAHGYEVLVAVDGVEGLNRARAERPDVVVTDVQMPRLDGFGLVEALKRDPGTRAIPVVIVSSLDRREDRAKGLALGADAYVVKQRFDQRALLDTIRQLV